MIKLFIHTRFLKADSSTCGRYEGLVVVIVCVLNLAADKFVFVYGKIFIAATDRLQGVITALLRGLLTDDVACWLATFDGFFYTRHHSSCAFFQRLYACCNTIADCPPNSAVNRRRPGFSGCCLSCLERSATARHSCRISACLLQSPQDSSL